MTALRFFAVLSRDNIVFVRQGGVHFVVPHLMSHGITQAGNDYNVTFSSSTHPGPEWEESLRHTANCRCHVNWWQLDSRVRCSRRSAQADISGLMAGYMCSCPSVPFFFPTALLFSTCQTLKTMSLQYLRKWAPFQIDALGLITLLGADEVDRAVGRLTRSHVTDWLPFLGVYKISSNSITEPIPGFRLFNITDGLLASDVTGWFSRWLLHQNIHNASTTIRIGRQQHPASRTSLPSAVFGILALAPPVVLSLLLRDWWGVVNGIAMVISVLVRRLVLQENEKALDENATCAWKDPKKAEEEVKVFLETPFGDAATVFTSRRVVVRCLLTTPRPQNQTYYLSIRFFGWLAFAAQVISLGMSCLFVQILTVVIVCLSTVLVIWQVGSDEHCVGKQLLLTKAQACKGEESRSWAYMRLDLNDTEQDSMVAWSLFPQRSNSEWWDDYNKRAAESRRRIGAEHGTGISKV